MSDNKWLVMSLDEKPRKLRSIGAGGRCSNECKILGGVGGTTYKFVGDLGDELMRNGVLGAYVGVLIVSGAKRSYELQGASILLVGMGVDTNLGAKAGLICAIGKQLVTCVDAIFGMGLIRCAADEFDGVADKQLLLSGVGATTDAIDSIGWTPSFHNVENGTKLMLRLSALISSNTSVDSM